jgi:hypothetical protein
VSRLRITYNTSSPNDKSCTGGVVRPPVFNQLDVMAGVVDRALKVARSRKTPNPITAFVKCLKKRRMMRMNSRSPIECLQVAGNSPLRIVVQQ